MRTGIKLLSTFAVLAISAAASACDSTREVAGPEAAPQFSAGSSANSQGVGKGGKKAGWTAVPGTLEGSPSSDRIGGSGGTLSVGGHFLVVRPGTLTGHGAYFSMTPTDGVAGFSLTAGSTAGSNDVGEAGFRRPVTLCIDYSAVEGLEASARLAIAEYTADGGLDLAESWDTGSHVCALLRHFSDYVMVSD